MPAGRSTRLPPWLADVMVPMAGPALVGLNVGFGLGTATVALVGANVLAAAYVLWRAWRVRISVHPHTRRTVDFI